MHANANKPQLRIMMEHSSQALSLACSTTIAAHDACMSAVLAWAQREDLLFALFGPASSIIAAGGLPGCTLLPSAGQQQPLLPAIGVDSDTPPLDSWRYAASAQQPASHTSKHQLPQALADLDVLQAGSGGGGGGTGGGGNKPLMPGGW